MELTRELGDQIGLMEDETITEAEAVEVIAHLVAIERAFDTLAVRDEPRGRVVSV